MNAHNTKAIAMALIIFGMLVLFANISIHFDLVTYSNIMRIVGLTISTASGLIFAYWHKAEKASQEQTKYTDY
jgi:hypothetical protein